MRIDGLLARATSLAPDVLIRQAGRLQTAVYKATGGRLGGRWAGRPVLLLTTTGRRSGEQRSTMVLYGRDGERFIVVGSNTGSDRPPAWALNLVAEPDAEVTVDGRRVPVRATEVQEAERARLWDIMCEQYGGFDVYRDRTGREIKVFALTPAAAAPRSSSARARTGGPGRR